MPGRSCGTHRPEQQAQVLAERLYRPIGVLAVYNIAHTFLHFPSVTPGANYLHRELDTVLSDVELERFREALSRVAQTSLVHSFNA